MNYIIRPVLKADEPFLWEMLYYAAHMEEEGENDIQAARRNSGLLKYVQGWGRESDRGFVASDPLTGRAVGAAWVRLLIGADKSEAYVDDETPELAIAVLPAYLGQGAGTQLLTYMLEAFKGIYPAIVLSVRANNPARYLYERLGFVTVGEITNRVGSKSFKMVAQIDHN